MWRVVCGWPALFLQPSYTLSKRQGVQELHFIWDLISFFSTVLFCSCLIYEGSKDDQVARFWLFAECFCCNFTDLLSPIWQHSLVQSYTTLLMSSIGLQHDGQQEVARDLMQTSFLPKKFRLPKTQPWPSSNPKLNASNSHAQLFPINYDRSKGIMKGIILRSCISAMSCSWGFRIRGTRVPHALCACCAKVGYFGPVSSDGKGDHNNYCVPIHRTAQILTYAKNSDRAIFHTENAGLLSRSTVFALQIYASLVVGGLQGGHGNG